MAKGSLLHWGPLVALSIITILFLGSIYSSLVWWPPVNTSGVINIILILIFLCCILYNFVKAAWLGPGHIPHRWKPDNVKEQKLMQFCKICDGYKAPRSHHCRQCNRCVMKMDHHCPWINNCVGHYNHKRFTLFLFFVVIGCSYVSYTLIGCVLQLFMINYNLFQENIQKALTTRVIINKLLKQLIQGNPVAYRELMEMQLVPFEFYHVMAIVFCIGLDIGVVLAVGILLYYQIRDIINNASSIESWIIDKSSYRAKKDKVFTYPYDLGTSENIKQVLHFSGDYIGDGFTWPVKKGCNQYTLTVDYCATEDFNGSFCGCRQGIRVCIACPWNMERRMVFSKGDHLTATRWRKHWLYGSKIENNQNVGDPEKGWFPRKCVVKIEDENQERKSKKE